MRQDCSFIGGTWSGTERVSLRGIVRIGTLEEAISENETFEGEIKIQQSGCDIEWFVEDQFRRRGSVQGNEIEVSGDAAEVTVVGGSVGDVQENSFTVKGKVCGSVVNFTGRGRFAAEISTPDGDGSIEVSFNSVARLHYRGTLFFPAATGVPSDTTVAAVPYKVDVAGLVSSTTAASHIRGRR